MDKDFVITLRLRADQVNLILSKLVLCPYGEVAEVVATLKVQGDAALDLARQGEQGQPAGNGLGAAAP